MKEDVLYGKMEEILKECVEADENVKLEPETVFAHIGLDSLTYINFLVKLEERFDMKFEDKYLDMNAFENAGGLVQYVIMSTGVGDEYEG